MYCAGAPNIGRRSLKTRLLNEYPSKFAEVKARKLLCVEFLLCLQYMYMYIHKIYIYMYIFISANQLFFHWEKNSCDLLCLTLLCLCLRSSHEYTNIYVYETHFGKSCISMRLLISCCSSF